MHYVREHNIAKHPALGPPCFLKRFSCVRFQSKLLNHIDKSLTYGFKRVNIKALVRVSITNQASTVKIDSYNGLFFVIWRLFLKRTN